MKEYKHIAVDPVIHRIVKTESVKAGKSCKDYIRDLVRKDLGEQIYEST